MCHCRGYGPQNWVDHGARGPLKIVHVFGLPHMSVKQKLMDPGVPQARNVIFVHTIAARELCCVAG